MRFVLVLLAVLLTGAAPQRVRVPDWTHRVTTTPTGSYVLGNPAAPVKLVEYLSYTCSHCAEFTAEAATPLRDRYVRTGKVSVEVRHALRDGLDLTAALLARCGPAVGFFARSEAIFAEQPAMIAKVQAWQAANPVPADADAAVRSFAAASGLTPLLTRLGVPPQRQARCLADPAMRATVTAQAAEAWQTRGITGTPAFLLDSELLGGNWTSLEPRLRTKVNG